MRRPSFGFRRFSSTSLWNMSPLPFGVEVMMTRLMPAIGFTMTAKTAFHTSFWSSKKANSSITR